MVDVSITIISATGHVDTTLTLADEAGPEAQVPPTLSDHTEDKSEPLAADTPKTLAYEFRDAPPWMWEATEKSNAATKHLKAVLDIGGPANGAAPTVPIQCNCEAAKCF